MIDASSPMSCGPPHTSEATPRPTSGYANTPSRAPVCRTISLRSRPNSIKTHHAGGSCGRRDGNRYQPWVLDVRSTMAVACTAARPT
jgi:hypothetical protein